MTRRDRLEMASLIREVLREVLGELFGTATAPSPTAPGPTLPPAMPGADIERLREIARGAIDPQLGTRKRASKQPGVRRVAPGQAKERP